MKSSAEIVLSDGNPSSRRWSTLRARSKRPLLATMIRSVTSRSTGLVGLRNDPHAHDPLAPDAFLPDDLTAQQQPEPVLQDVDDVRRQAAIRLAPEVGDVGRDPTARLEHANAIGEHVGEQLEVFEVRARHAIALELLLVLLAGEVRAAT